MDRTQIVGMADMLTTTLSRILAGGSQKRCTKGGDRVRVGITHLLSIKKINIGDFHVSVAINI